MESKNLSINPAAYVICLQMNNNRLVISQPNLGIFDGTTDMDSVKNLHEIGNAVANMLIKVKKEIAKRTVLGIPIPPPVGPKALFEIPEQEWVTLPAAATYLRVSESTMRRLFLSQTIPCRRTSGKRYRVLKADLDFYIKTGAPLFAEEPRCMELRESQNGGSDPSLVDFLLSPEQFFEQAPKQI